MDSLVLENLEVSCIVGERPEERLRETVLRVDAALSVPARAAAASDDLSDAVDYASLAERIASALREARCRLLERAAETVARECLADPRVESVRVRVGKRSPVPSLGAACVEVVRP